LLADESVVLSPEITGRISEILFQEGQEVKQGDALIRLDDSIYRAQLAQAEANIVFSRSNYQRAQALYQKKNVTERDRDEALAKFNVDEAALTLAKAQLDKTVIKAPFNGIVGLRQVSVGDYVTPGQKLVNFENIDPLKAEFRVAEIYLGAVRPGQTVGLTVDAFPERVFQGEVYAIDPRIDSAGRSVILRARLANPDKVLRPGLFARVRLVVDRKEGAALVDEQALIPQGNDQFVYVVADGKAVLKKVRTGQRQGQQVEIVEGLSPGDVVITAGQMKLRPGMPVSIINTAPAEQP
ncbi:MAG: efflux RND transporter periplasmic adaptor subunit, partial [Pseudomonadota bacterium]|nr:efflux RND transporter periplasmic adaptor subunit [Pseudomonadota bacterium]